MKNTTCLTLGIIGTVIGTLALLVSWVPFLGLPAVPVGIIGAILSCVGIGIAAVKKSRGYELPALGALLCICAVSISLVSSHLANVALQNKMAQIAKEQQDREVAEAIEKAELRAQELQQAAIEKTNLINTLNAQINQLSLDFTNAQTDLQDAQADYATATAGYENFIQSKPYLTNAVYVGLVKQNADLNRKYSRDSTEIANYQASAYAPRSTALGSSQAIERQRQGVYATSAQQEMMTIPAKIRANNLEMEEIVSGGLRFWRQKEEESKQKLTIASIHFSSTQNKLNMAQSKLALIVTR